MNAALLAAKPGDTILLAPGTYGKVVINKVNFAAPVTIAPADKNASTVLEGVSIGGSSGLRLVDLEVTVRPKEVGVYVVNSSDMAFERLRVHGQTPADGVGIMVRNMTKVAITDSEIYDVNDGVAHLDCDDLVISGNRIHGIGEDGIRGGGSSKVTVSKNELTDFTPSAAWIHPDAIQFWGTKPHPVMEDITISNNVYTRGSGTPAQGIFVSDGSYRRLEIRENALVGSMYNGILVFHADGATIGDNLVQGFEDMTSWIRIEQSNDVRLTGNASSGYIDKNDSKYVDKHNDKLGLARKGDLKALHRWQLQKNVRP